MDLTKTPLLTAFFFHIYAKRPSTVIASVTIMQACPTKLELSETG